MLVTSSSTVFLILKYSLIRPDCILTRFMFKKEINGKSFLHIHKMLSQISVSLVWFVVFDCHLVVTWNCSVRYWVFHFEYIARFEYIVHIHWICISLKTAQITFCSKCTLKSSLQYSTSHLLEKSGTWSEILLFI